MQTAKHTKTYVKGNQSTDNIYMCVCGGVLTQWSCHEIDRVGVRIKAVQMNGRKGPIRIAIPTLVFGLVTQRDCAVFRNTLISAECFIFCGVSRQLGYRCTHC